MQTGVVFPQSEIGADPGAIRSYAEAVRDLGYKHVSVYDHVLGADPTNRPGWRGYTHETMFHEPFVLFGYLSAIAPELELATDVIVLPQRQTALVAKQAAEVDVLSGGRLRLGVGIGWNAVEYEALGMSFRTRARYIEEQVEVLRLLWTQEIVTYRGRWHTVTEAGLNPLPVQRPIPIWMGGSANVLLRRVARIGDGWFPQGKPGDMRELVERLRAYAQEEGRDPSAIGIEARINVGDGTPDDWARWAEEWRALDATHIGVNTMNAGYRSLDAHLDALRRYVEVAGP
ncbi:MAG: LLM class F420-dependent oxidoreductase [Chloroflexota bacterium]|nr:LLM class F420-dependent oxidoreductase [Chloroflexota bacterium]